MPPFCVGFSKQRKKPGWRRSSNCVQNAFFQLFPFWRHKKKSREIKFYNFFFMAPYCVGFSKQRKKPGWRRSSNCVQNAFFRLSPSGRNEKTPLDSSLPISDSYHHFGCAFLSSAKSRVDEGRHIACKTRFFDFPHRGETKNTLGIEFTNFGFIPPFWVGYFKQRKKPGWRRSSNCVQNAFFRLSPSERNAETPLESILPISISYHHFGWAFASSGKSRVDEGRPIAFKTRFFNFSHLGQTKKTAVGSNFTISVSCHHFGWAFPSSGKSPVDEGRPIAFKTRFLNFPHRGETKKQPWDRILQLRFHATILGGLIQAAEKAALTKVVQLRSKLVFSTIPIGAKRKNTLGIEFHEVGFKPQFWVGFSKQRKKPAV